MAGPFLSKFTVIDPDRWPARSGKVVLTFDNGPHPDGEVSFRLLDVLRARGVPATFFYIGQNVVANPAAVRQALADGHTVANHTFTHRWQTLGSRETFAEELRRTDEAIREAAGRAGFHSRLVRPPYGLITPAVRDAVQSTGREIPRLSFFIRDGWADDWAGPLIVARLKRKLLEFQGGAMILHETRFPLPADPSRHPSKAWLPAAVDDLITWAWENGLSFTTYPESEED